MGESPELVDQIGRWHDPLPGVVAMGGARTLYVRRRYGDDETELAFDWPWEAIEAGLEALQSGAARVRIPELGCVAVAEVDPFISTNYPEIAALAPGIEHVPDEWGEDAATYRRMWGVDPYPTTEEE